MPFKIELVVAWYDAWIGVFIDRKKKKIYLFAVPFVGLVFSLKHKEQK